MANVRKVRTAEGSRFYGKPIGSPITAADIAAARARSSEAGRAKGQKIAQQRGGGDQGGAPAAPQPRSLPSRAPATGGRRATPRTRPDAKPVSVKQSNGAGAGAPPKGADKPAFKISRPKPKTRADQEKTADKDSIRVGENSFDVEPGSETFSREGSPFQYNLDGEKVRAFNEDGEIGLDEAQQARLRELLDVEQDSFDIQEHDLPEEPEGVEKKPAAKPKADPKPKKGDVLSPEQASKLPARSRVTSPSGRNFTRVSDEDEWISDSGIVSPSRTLPSKGLTLGDDASDEDLQRLFDAAVDADVERHDFQTDHTDEWGHPVDLDMDGPKKWNATSMGTSVAPPTPEEVQDLMGSIYTGKHMNPDGTFTAERTALHDRIINGFLEGLKPSANPTQYMNGGGPASGKGTMTRGANKDLTKYPSAREVDDMTGGFLPMEGEPGALLIDPDAIKQMFPEVQDARRRIRESRESGGEIQDGDKAWAGAIHEESSQVAKRLHRAAIERGYNVIYDGTGNGSVKSVMAKLQVARDAGYRIEANYLTLDPDEGVKRAISRAERSDRWVPEPVIRKTYEAIPDIFQDLIDANAFDSVRLFDNNVGPGEPSKLIGQGDRDGFDVIDPDRYGTFQEGGKRAKESIADKARAGGSDSAIQEDLQTTRSAQANK